MASGHEVMWIPWGLKLRKETMELTGWRANSPAGQEAGDIRCCVGMSLVAGTLLRTIGYEGLCWGAAGIILLSIPFALAIRVDPGVESGDS